MGKKNKGSIQQEEQSPPQDQGQSMEFEVVPDQPESPEDDAWFTSTGKGQSAVEHVPVTRSQAKKEKASEVIVEGDITHETDRKSKKQAKKEKLAEETKKAEEEAAKKAKEEVLFDKTRQKHHLRRRKASLR